MSDDKTDRLFDKLRALLAKAESSEYDEERDAFEAKAADLMFEHAISREDLGNIHTNGTELEKRMYQYESLDRIMGPTYRPQRLNAIAMLAQDCFGLYACWIPIGKSFGKDPTMFYLVGRTVDLDRFEQVAMLLNVQCQRKLSAREDNLYLFDAAETKNYRRGVVIGFYSGIIQRFQDQMLLNDHETGSDFLPALRSAHDAAEEFADIGETKESQISWGSEHGRMAGRDAAEIADLGNARIEEQPTGPLALN